MESSLSLKLADFEAKVGLFFGWGAGADSGDQEWDTRKKAVIKDCVQSGLRQFYFPVPLGGTPYDWSFLKPTATITLAASTSTNQLPDDFGGFEGKISVSTPSSRWRHPVSLVNEGIIRELYVKSPARTGVPAMASIRPIKGNALATEGQRMELFFFPTTDVEFTVTFPYYILANYLDGTHPYAYGGMAHAETILESCLAIAEQRYDDAAGVHSEKYLERLAASIATDRRLKPQTGLRNTDESDLEERYGWRDREALATYNGILYE